MTKNLTNVQRTILMNQELILAQLYPEDKEFHEWNASLFKHGIAGKYPMTVEAEISLEVVEETDAILQMFLDIHGAIAKLSEEDKKELDLNAIKYEGFDPKGPHYGVIIHYHKERAKRGYLTEQMKDRVENNDRYLSPLPQFTLERYRKMHECFLNDGSIIRYSSMIKEGLQALIDAVKKNTIPND